MHFKLVQSAQSPYFGINECVAPPPYLSSNHRPWCCGTEGCMSHRHLWRTHTSRDVSSQHAAATGRCQCANWMGRFSGLVKWVVLEDTDILWGTLFILIDILIELLVETNQKLHFFLHTKCQDTNQALFQGRCCSWCDGQWWRGKGGEWRR